MKIFIGSDHAGFKLKMNKKDYLSKLNIDFKDLGSFEFNKNDDYPDFAKKVAKQVSKNKNNRGILICDSGIGMCITANKIKNVYATTVCNLKSVKVSRKHNNSNVLCFGQDYITLLQAKKVIKAWLQTDFSKAKRHCRRIDKIKKIEKGL